MKYRAFGGTGLQISEVGFGCGGTAGLMTGDDLALQLRTIARALDLGVNYFDTAPTYGEGRSEENLGRALHELGGTDAIVATKVTLSWADFNDIPRAIRRSIEGSLKRLKRDRLEVVHLHNRIGRERAAKAELGSGAVVTVDDVIGAGGVLETLESLKQEGRVGVLGCCAFGSDPSCIARVIDSGRFGSVLINYSLLNASAWQPCAVAGTRLDYEQVGTRAASRGMGTVALRILEGGLLTGPRKSLQNASGVAGSYGATLEHLREISLSEGVEDDLAQLALRFVLSNPRVSTALVGISSIEQLEAAAAGAAQGPLPTAVLDRIAVLHRSIS